MTRARLALVLAALLGASGCGTSPPVSGDAPSAVRDNRAEVVARVVGVERLDGGRFRLRLRLETVRTTAGPASQPEAGQTLVVYPNLLRSEGDPTADVEAHNAHMLAAAGLAPGTQIEAVIEDRGSAWLLHDWSTP